MTFRGLEWLFPLVVSLHNAEEAIAFPGWSGGFGRRWHGSVTPGVFRFAAAVLSLLAIAVTWMSVISGRQTVWTYLAFGYIAAMLVNVLVPHVAATIALRRYVPGVATAVLLNLPVLTEGGIRFWLEGCGVLRGRCRRSGCIHPCTVQGWQGVDAVKPVGHHGRSCRFRSPITLPARRSR